MAAVAQEAAVARGPVQAPELVRDLAAQVQPQAAREVARERLERAVAATLQPQRLVRDIRAARARQTLARP